MNSKKPPGPKKKHQEQSRYLAENIRNETGHYSHGCDGDTGGDKKPGAVHISEGSLSKRYDLEREHHQKQTVQAVLVIRKRSCRDGKK